MATQPERAHRAINKLSITPLLHHSITPLLHYSITPLLHYSITPLLHHCQRILEAVPRARVIGIDADPKMLEEAARRLSGNGGRIDLRVQDFFSELPTAQNAYFADLALHHVLSRSAKQALYRKIYDALLPGGLFVNADAMFDESAQMRRRWTSHLISSGFAEAEASNHIQSWRKEDNYFGLPIELELLRNAGFSAQEVVWRYGPMAIITGVKLS